MKRIGTTSGLLVCVLLAMWSVPAAAVHQRPGPRSPRELLELHGIDASHFVRLQNGEPIGPADEETIVRILQRWPRFAPHVLEDWSRNGAEEWSAIVDSPSEAGGSVFRLRGRVTHIERVPIVPELATRLEFGEYYRVSLQLDAPGRVAILCTRTVPTAWQSHDDIDEPAGAMGLFLKVQSAGDGLSELVFAADRVAWFPDRAGGALDVSSDLVYLASLGLDVSLFDDVRPENKKPLTLADRECFYGMLAAIQRAERRDFLARSPRTLELVPLLRDPASHHGELGSVVGIARRAVKVRIDDEEVRQRWGIDHYYQIDLFVELNQQVIRLALKEQGKEQPIFENAYPFTVCVPSLPPELPESDTLRENVRVHAAFFKLWSYPTEYMSSFDKQLLQVSPMLIGLEPRVVPPTAMSPAFGAGLIVLLIVTLGGIWLGVRRHGRSGGVSTVEESRQLPDKPDFGNLS